ncbi:MGDG synthase family glycosyltransferase [Alkalicoccobacillus gibsonii]|uniref:MGDG synthase family glycosyltransferase n=1 Tax=Alkalicoccobacillus gibsonii TaxID=79881 RepID=UPI00193354B6|nr:glycosyltransferase [Alkalicoccobacillus gibsonii]MBM0067326.1 hypothetical protein [Alkalicoccobacillus gibsonii]
MVNIKAQPLLLHASIGYGHTKTAHVLAAEIKRSTQYKPEVVDLFSSLPVWQQTMIRKSYFTIIGNTPFLWDVCYRYTSQTKKSDLWFERLARPLYDTFNQIILKSHRPFILSTHVLITRLLAVWIKRSSKNIPLYHINTDFKLHRLAVHPQVSGYFLSGLEAFPPQTDVPSTCYYSYGIPIEHSECRLQNKDVLKDRLGLSRNKPVVMVAGGGEGIARYEEIIKGLNRIPQITILCFTGINQRLLLKVKQLGFEQDIQVMPFTDKFSMYVQASDVLITKAGGLTLAHALTVTTPVVIYQPLPGQEIENALLLKEKKAAILAEDESQLYKAVHTVLFNKEKRSLYLKHAQALSKPHATSQIIQQIILETPGHEPFFAPADA